SRSGCRSSARPSAPRRPSGSRRSSTRAPPGRCSASSPSWPRRCARRVRPPIACAPEKGSLDMAYKAFDLTGKTAIVTGGNSGIGLGMAEAMAQAGAAVCIWGTNEDKNVHALARLHAIGGKALALRCDVSDETAVEHAFAETVSTLGGVDACFVNAGVSGRGAAASFAEMTTEEWHRVLAVNLDGAFFTLRAAARHMTARGAGGSLAVTASLAALEGSPLSAHYAASKGAMLSVMRALSVGL